MCSILVEVVQGNVYISLEYIDGLGRRQKPFVPRQPRRPNSSCRREISERCSADHHVPTGCFSSDWLEKAHKNLAKALNSLQKKTTC